MCCVSRIKNRSQRAVLCLIFAVCFVFAGLQELRAAEATSGKVVLNTVTAMQPGNTD